MPKAKMSLPVRGVADATPHVETPGDLAPPQGALNVRPRRAGVGGGRRQIGSRPGMKALFPIRLPRPQTCGSITRASGITGYQTGEQIAIDGGRSVEQGKYRTQCVLLDRDWSIEHAFVDTRADPAFAAPATGPGGPGGFYCCFHDTDPDIGYFGTLTKDLSHTTQDVWVCGLNRINVATHQITHQAYVVDADPGYTPPLPASPPAQLRSFPNQIVQFGVYLFVAVNHWVYTFRADTLEYLSRTAVEWAIEVQGIRVREVAGRHFVFALYSGSASIQGPVVLDTSGSNQEAFGEHFRSGIALLEITYANHSTTAFPPQAAPPSPQPVAAGTQALVRRSMILGRLAADPLFELHRDYRFSEWSVTRPVGRIPYAFDMDSNGVAYVGTANQGFGPDPLANANQRPNGPANVSTLNQYISIGKHVLSRALESDSPVWTWDSTTVGYIDPTMPVRYGPSSLVGGWERDFPGGSYQRTFLWGAGTYRADIPPITAGGRDPANEDFAPTVYAVALHESANRLIIAGRRPAVNAGRPNVACLRASDGVLQWTAAVVGLVQQGAIAIDPTTGNPVVAGNRNTNWGDGSAWAELWELDIQSGEIVRAWDFTNAVNVNGFIASAYASCGAYGVAINSRGQVLVALAPFRHDT